MHDYQAIASELRDKDFSAAVYTGLLNPVGLGKRGAEGVAASIALHRERLVSTGCTSKEGHVGRQESKGQPFLDCYMALSALGMGPGMAPDATLQLDVVWRAMEDLIYDGTVRSIGICNVTLLQLEALLRMPSLRIRPASVSIEHHPYVGCAALDAFLEYANVQRIAVFAHTPLAQGTHLEEDERLRQSVGLSPAQATLRFSLDKGLSVTPGALTLAHIAENLATPLDVTPPALPPLEGGVVTAWPLAVIPKWSSYIAMNGGGALADDEEGHVCATILSSEELLTPIIEKLPRRARPLERRKIIGKALAELEEGASGEPLLAQMQVVRFADFVAHGSVPRRSSLGGSVVAGAGAGSASPEAKGGKKGGSNSSSPRRISFFGKLKKGSGGTPREAKLHVSMAELPDEARIIFISQRWLRREHPDDEQGSKHKSLQVAAASWAALEGVSLDDLYVWFDYSSIDQDDFSELFRCVNALGLYVACSDCFISFDHPEYWGRAWCLAEQMFGDAVRLPRFVLHTADAHIRLAPLDTGKVLRQQLVDPITGQLTVETDRAVIEVLKHVATHIRARLWFGALSKQMSLMMLEQSFSGPNEAQHELGTHGASD